LHPLIVLVAALGDQFSARFVAAVDDATRTRMWLRFLSDPGRGPGGGR
jgi:hypothetical protein